MKNISKLVVGLMFLSGIASAACFGPYCYDDKGAQVVLGLNVPSMTLAQMNVNAPGYTGQLIVVTDGIQGKLCISSGTAAGAYTVTTATAPAAGALQHCS